jgi:excisionase family DNA binding protein
MRRYLTTSEAAAYLGLTVPALYMRVHRNEIPYHKFGKRALRFDPRKLDAFLERGERHAVQG